MKRSALITCCFLLVGCATVEVGGQPVTEYSVSRPFGLFDVQERRDELARNPRLADRVCRGGKTNASPASPPVEVLGHGKSFGILNNPDRLSIFAGYAQNQLAGHLRTGDKRYLERLRDWMVVSAEANSLTVLVPDADKYRYIDPLFNLRFGLIPLIVGYDALRQTGTMSAQQENLISSWLERVVENSDKGRCEMPKFCPDASYHRSALRGTSFMLWGAVSANDKWFHKGLTHYGKIIASLRGDGSNPFDVAPAMSSGARGQRALRKQNQIVGYLVVMAEIAHQQGVDLYSAKSGDKDIWLALDFLVRGIKDDSVVGRHTGESFHETPFLHQSQNNDETTAWFEILERRFASHRLTGEFAELAKAGRPWKSAAYGGNLTCWFWNGQQRGVAA